MKPIVKAAVSQLREIARLGSLYFRNQPPDAILDDVILSRWPEAYREVLGERNRLSQLTAREADIVIGVLARLVEEGHSE